MKGRGVLIWYTGNRCSCGQTYGNRKCAFALMIELDAKRWKQKKSPPPKKATKCCLVCERVDVTQNVVAIRATPFSSLW